MVKKQCKLKFRPFEILAIKDGVIWASEMEFVGTLTTIDALLVFLHPSHTMLLYVKIFEVESLFLWAFVVALVRLRTAATFAFLFIFLFLIYSYSDNFES